MLSIRVALVLLLIHAYNTCMWYMHMIHAYDTFAAQCLVTGKIFMLLEHVFWRTEENPNDIRGQSPSLENGTVVNEIATLRAQPSHSVTPLQIKMTLVQKWTIILCLNFTACVIQFFLHRQYRIFFYVLLTVHISTILDGDERDAHLFYFTIYLLHSSTCFEHCMLIIRRLNSIDAGTGPPLTESTIPDAASIQFNLLMMSI